VFRTLVNKTVRFLKQEDGPTAVEYAVMLALILVVAVIAVASVGSPTKQSFERPELKGALKIS
jgi:pilus assembly protein Flp/PilA